MAYLYLEMRYQLKLFGKFESKMLTDLKQIAVGKPSGEENDF